MREKSKSETFVILVNELQGLYNNRLQEDTICNYAEHFKMTLHIVLFNSIVLLLSYSPNSFYYYELFGDSEDQDSLSYVNMETSRLLSVPLPVGEERWMGRLV